MSFPLSLSPLQCIHVYNLTITYTVCQHKKEEYHSSVSSVLIFCNRDSGLNLGTFFAFLTKYFLLSPSKAFFSGSSCRNSLYSFPILTSSPEAKASAMTSSDTSRTSSTSPML
ncbi:hypothetical protein BSP15_115 [Bacillus phage BSP15]|nr:hypothetical protein BSP15_115 [Bacillus phage BSP15]